MCGDDKPATQKHELYELPQYLIIHLKRFIDDNYGNVWKVNDNIDYQLKNLDLEKFVLNKDQETKFDLISAIYHSGSMNGGHYTAARIDESTGQWYECNDSHVSEMRESEVKSKNAYVLVYKWQ